MKYLSISLFLLLVISCGDLAKRNKIDKINALKAIIERDDMKVSDSIVNESIQAFQSYAKLYPEDSITPQYLFDAAALYRRYFHSPEPAYELYSKIYTKYPHFSKRPECLFLQGMVLADEMNMKKEAEEKYMQFAKDYPNHFLAPSIPILIEQLNMTDEEIIASFKSKHQSDTLK